MSLTLSEGEIGKLDLVSEETNTRPEWQVQLRQLKREVDEKAKALQMSSSFLSELKRKAQDSLYSAYRDIEPLEPQRTEDKRVSAKIKELLSSIQTLTTVPAVPETEALDKVLLDGPRYLSFFGKKGSNVVLSSDGRLASRLRSNGTGNLLFGDFPCRVTSTGIRVELVVKKQQAVTGSLASIDGLTVGLTLTNPKSFSLVPKSCVNVPESFLIGFNGQTLDPTGTFSSSDNYHPALLKNGDRITLLVPSYGSLTGRMLLLINGKLQVLSHARLPVLERHLFLVVDLIGVTEAVSLVNEQAFQESLSIVDLELLVKQPVHNIKGCHVDKAGSNVKVSDDRKMANRLDCQKDFGNLLTLTLPQGKDQDQQRTYFEIRVKKIYNSQGKGKATSFRNFLRIGVLHSRQEMLPPLISQLPNCSWLEVASLQTSISVGLLVEPHRLSVFLNGVLTGTKETAAEGAHAGVIELGEGISCISVLDNSQRLLYTKLEVARVKAVDAAKYIQRVYRSVRLRRKWRNLVRLGIVKSSMKKKEENKIEKLLEQQILLQHRLIEKIDKIHDRPINSNILSAPAPIDLPNYVGAVMKPLSSNVSVDTAGRSIVRLDDFKSQLIISGVESYCKLLFTCDKKTLGVNVGLLKNSASCDFVIACNLNGDVLIDGTPGPKLQPKPVQEGNVMEVAVDNRKFVVLVNNKLLCRLDIPPQSAFVTGTLGMELWGGARGVSFFGDPRMQSLMPVDAKAVRPALQKYNINRPGGQEDRRLAERSPSESAKSPLSASSISGTASSHFSGSLDFGASGNFFKRVIDLLPHDMLGESSSDDDYLKSQPLQSDLRGNKVVANRRVN